MEISYRFYNKALKAYNNGLIDKAIKLCEQSISEDMKNKNALNLKGLLCYFKGQLKEARALWKLNNDLNKDKIAGKYLADSEFDKNNVELYRKALVLIKKLDINAALNILQNCEKSDFNCINVDNYLAVCFIKKGEYSKANFYIEKVLKIDRKNNVAIKNKRVLMKFGVIKKRPKYVSAVCAFLIAAVAFTFGIHYLSVKLNTKAKSYTKVGAIKTNKTKTVKHNYKQVPAKKTASAAPKNVFEYDKIKDDIDNKKFDELYDEIQKSSGVQVDENGKVLIANANRLLKSEGVEFFYFTGMNYFSSGDYNRSSSYLYKAYNLGEDNYLYQHIIYMLGSAAEKLGNTADMDKYYSQYDSKFQSGVYEDAVLYKLATLNKDIDINKAKSYAQKLQDKFPDSMYNNSVIKVMTQ